MDALSTGQDGSIVNCFIGATVHYSRMGGTPSDKLPTGMRPDVTAPRITALREALGLKKSEMADALGCDRSAWTKYETGERAFPGDLAYRASELYGVSMDYFYRGRLDNVEADLRGKILGLANAR